MQPLLAIESTPDERRQIGVAAEVAAQRLAELDDELHREQAVCTEDASLYFLLMHELRDRLRQLNERGYSATDADCGTADRVATRAHRTARMILAALPAMGSA